MLRHTYCTLLNYTVEYTRVAKKQVWRTVEFVRLESGLGFILKESFRQGYPSGFTVLEVSIICAAVIVLTAVIIIGNLLVIIAIFSEFALQNVQNWFVASLAVADLTLGIFVMPFSLAQEVMGYWIFGDIW